MIDYYVVAMSHVDVAFVNREEAQAEFVEVLLERVLNVLERHPELHFGLEQALHYRKLEGRRPDLFRKVKEFIKEGRLEFLGAMATTADTNFPNGECLVRNQGMGMRWVEEHLGTKPTVGWLVDTFGIHDQIPQMMKQFGFQHVHANRFGGNKRYDMFWDEGLDGSRLLIIGKDSWCYNVFPDTQSFYFCRDWNDMDKVFRDADRLSGDLPKLVSYYTENEELFSEYYLKLTEERNGAGNWKHATYREYSEALKERGLEGLPVLKGNLNPEFTGTYALRTPIRIENRRAETMLLEAERWEALLGNGNPDRKEDMENSWWDLFFCQFHDAFSGSVEDVTYENILNKLHGVQEAAARVQRDALKLKEEEGSVLCCNSLPWEREEWAAVQDGEGRERYFLVKAPAGGIRQYRLEELKSAGVESKRPGREIRNEYLRLALDEREGIRYLADLDGNCFIDGAPDFLTAEEDRGGMQVELCEGREIFAVTGKVAIGTVMENDMEQQITMSGTFPAMGWNHGRNTLSWDARFSLRRGEKAVRLKLTLDWHGEATRIRLRIPGCMPGRDVFFEVPYGVVRRDSYRNRPTARGEWPAHRFAAIESGSRGFALINKGAAGVEQEGSALVTTLIRAYGEGEMAWVKPSESSSQCGKSTFEFMIAPYTGSCREGNIVQMAQEFNQPVKAWPGRSALEVTEESWYALDQKNLVLSAVKNAWDGSDDLIVRIYETEGNAVTGKLYLKGLQEVYQSDMTEAKGALLPWEGEFITLAFQPFEIRTVRVVRKKS